MQAGFSLGFPAAQFRSKRLLEERVVPIGAVAVVKWIDRHVRARQLAQDSRRPGSLEDVVADLSGQVLEDDERIRNLSRAGDASAKNSSLK